jgi:hypothetical protein
MMLSGFLLTVAFCIGGYIKMESESIQFEGACDAISNGVPVQDQDTVNIKICVATKNKSKESSCPLWPDAPVEDRRRRFPRPLCTRSQGPWQSQSLASIVFPTMTLSVERSLPLWIYGSKERRTGMFHSLSRELSAISKLGEYCLSNDDTICREAFATMDLWIEGETKDRDVSVLIKGVVYAGSLLDIFDLYIPFEDIRLQDVVSNATSTPTPSPSTLVWHTAAYCRDSLSICGNAEYGCCHSITPAHTKPYQVAYMQSK